MVTLIGLKTCSTCREIEKILRQNDIDFEYQDVRESRPTTEQIRGWLSLIGEENIGKIVNASGQVYRDLKLKDQWPSMSVDQKINILGSDGMLIKRPILIDNKQVYIGKEVKLFLLGE